MNQATCLLEEIKPGRQLRAINRQQYVHSKQQVERVRQQILLQQATSIYKPGQKLVVQMQLDPPEKLPHTQKKKRAPVIMLSGARPPIAIRAATAYAQN